MNQNYTVDTNTGFLLIAYPEKDEDTEFEFEYWVADFSEGLA
jgi:hypothetical protein